MSTVANIERKRGDTYPITVNILTSDGTAYNLTGVTASELGVSINKENDSPDDAEYKTTGVVQDAPGGVIEFPVTNAMAALPVGKYYAEVQFVQSGYIRTTNTFTYKVLAQIIT